MGNPTRPLLKKNQLTYPIVMILKITNVKPIKDSEKKRIVVLIDKKYGSFVTKDSTDELEFKAALTGKLGSMNIETNSSCNKAVSIPDTDVDVSGEFVEFISLEKIKLVDAE